MRILDVGCSNGALGASLRGARSGRSVIGIEINPAFAAEADGRLDTVICANLNDFEWQTALGEMQFDCIIFADVLEHLSDPERQICEAKSRLIPGGCIVISLPNIRHLSSFYSIFLSGTFPRRDRGIFDRTHVRWFTIKDAKRLLAEAGMRVERASFILRLGDKGGGLMNRIAIRVLSPIQRFPPIREFMTYQFCLRAVSLEPNTAPSL